MQGGTDEQVAALRRGDLAAAPVSPAERVLLELARVLPAHRENGREVPPRIVVYRRPLEIRAHDREDLADLVRDVVVDQVAVLLGRDPEEIDPTG